MNPRYNPERDDPVLTELNQLWRLADYEIGDRMGYDKQVIAINRKRLGLPNNRAPGPPLRPRDTDAGAKPKDKPNPLKVAEKYLLNRLSEKNGLYWVDGVPASLEKIMRETNLILKASGIEQIGHSPRWLV